jgi:hypothetical protein
VAIDTLELGDVDVSRVREEDSVSDIQRRVPHQRGVTGRKACQLLLRTMVTRRFFVAGQTGRELRESLRFRIQQTFMALQAIDLPVHVGFVIEADRLSHLGRAITSEERNAGPNQRDQDHRQLPILR